MLIKNSSFSARDKYRWKTKTKSPLHRTLRGMGGGGKMQLSPHGLSETALLYPGCSGCKSLPSYLSKEEQPGESQGLAGLQIIVN